MLRKPLCGTVENHFPNLFFTLLNYQKVDEGVARTKRILDRREKAELFLLWVARFTCFPRTSNLRSLSQALSRECKRKKKRKMERLLLTQELTIYIARSLQSNTLLIEHVNRTPVDCNKGRKVEHGQNFSSFLNSTACCVVTATIWKSL